MVVHVSPELELVRLLDDPGGVLAGHGQVEVTPRVYNQNPIAQTSTHRRNTELKANICMRKIIHLRSPISRFPRGREFAHAGKFGDVIYALPTIRALGGGKLWLHDWACETRMAMTPEAVEVIRPLLLLQPYITEVSWRQQRPSTAVDLSTFRLHSNRFARSLPLTRQVLRCCGLSEHLDVPPWLHVDFAVSHAPVVMARSSRYQNPNFPWREAVQKYGHKAVFLGTQEEHRVFVDAFGAIPWAYTADLLEAARIIAGARLFVGNQSALRAIAEGLKANVVQEVCLEMPNTCFGRPGEINISAHCPESLPLCT
jgi:hypothetical protein